ncbi:taste receptor type 2 member 40-like [Latimeria chalumnae]|uniref:taste receptor type 2 member 40-like n=1 Tax=Latimeria chalumnae TaxID=7897 RepID=UPI0003C1B393|nr:PREDICTED: taste receptor type 2 member 40-like [Latimeria chalumnae]|eukprot:XP_006013621.1 PREDICTED: taste receptor type 2 member 40-like [Latimeria chalumnae]
MGAAAILQLFSTMIIIGFGCLGNSFIVLVFLVEYRRGRTLQAYELIVTLLATCSIVNELLHVIWFTIYFFNLCFYNGETFFKWFSLLQTFFPKAATWLTAWLCCIYCVKIIKVNWRFFMRLKQRISLAVKCMIIVTAVLCSLLAMPVLFMVHLKGNSSNNCRELYIQDDEKELSFLFTSMLSLFTSLLPLVFMLVSSLGIVIFLCRHSKNMDKNVTPSSTSRNEAHTSVAIMLLCLIALFIVCAGTVLFVNLNIAPGRFDLLVVISLSNIIYSSGSPVILIVGMVKLRNTFAKLFCQKER